ncbi:MAG: hypothetical protein J3R72DRAFT_523772 [Linnemannia gamsii]|nr:MAG: hypothetical protein J3R72DRAFT_523771 [Linnemannia gamsii]KAK3842320.1 MAG: hypothetical protein J3R72DRAFT_523772 [Linnemannia gamsii]
MVDLLVMSTAILFYPKMHFKSLLLVCGLLSIAAANPTRKTCDSPEYNTQVCCNGVLSIATCAVQVLTQTCSADTYCCKADSAGGLVNISAANCLKLQ